MAEISKKITKELTIPAEKYNELRKTIKNIFDFKKSIEAIPDKDASNLSMIILGGGVILNVSDLHIEPEEGQAKIRSRIDGVLQDITNLNQATYESLLSRIKLLSGIKLNISDRPQDGRFSVITPETPIDVRVSSLPAEHGESLVLRILNPKGLIELETLGLRKDLLDTFKMEIRKPNGMIIVTGPTGSGKTTTLYAFLKRVNKPETKIITIEDPIEYHIKGISQTQTDAKKGYDFASGLKSIMRQDPDVILVGEVRDAETAKIALQAALTGHLVFSTLHTNDAAGTVSRLVSLGAKLQNIGPALNMAIAQRLIRKVCKKCAQKQKISPQLMVEIKKGLNKLPKTVKVPKLGSNAYVLQAKGCKACNNAGFSGRIGVYESFIIDGEMEKFILTSPPISVLREEARKKGMVTMYQDGLIKVLEGITTIEELKRVIMEQK